MSTNTKSKAIGKQSIMFENPPHIIGYSSVAGKKEGEGPLGTYFDEIEVDPLVGGKTWEEGESLLQKRAAELAISKAGLKNEDIRYMIAGDLLAQLIATSFGISSLDIPLFGIYGACSNMGESMALGAIMVDGGFADRVIALTSSHNASAEKQFRFPLNYGNQRPLASTWTVTGSGAVIIGNQQAAASCVKEGEPHIVIKAVTTGKIVDYGIKDSMNMGASMAPAAADVIYANFTDLGVKEDHYDKILTGDLGFIGRDIVIDIMKEKGYDIASIYTDCGIEIFCPEEQDTHSGGSGCGCSALTLTGYIFHKMKTKEWKRVLFVPTGALLSTVSFNEGNSVPGIAHAVVLEVV